MVKRIVGKQLIICLESWTQVSKGDGIKKKKKFFLSLKDLNASLKSVEFIHVPKWNTAIF